jgi:hypothetical protein
MTGPDNPPKDFSDYLGEYLANGAAVPKTLAAVSEPKWRHDFDNSLVQIAKAIGEDPGDILKRFHTDEPLARAFREAVGVSVASRPISAAVETYVISERFRACGLRGKANYRAVAEEINSARGAAGNRFRTIDVESVRKTAKRGERQFAAEMAGVVGSLAGLFGQSELGAVLTMGQRQ